MQVTLKKIDNRQEQLFYNLTIKNCKTTAIKLKTVCK